MEELTNYKKKDIYSSLLAFTVSILLFTVPVEKIIDPKITYETLFIVSRFKIWASLILLYIFISKIQKQNFLLWAETKYPVIQSIKSIFLTLLIIFIVMIIFGLIIKLSKINLESEKFKIVAHFLKNKFALLFFVCLTAGVTEELFFRGFLLPRLALVFNNYPLAIFVSSVLFGLLHFSYGTLSQILGPIIIGLIFAIHYYQYRNLKILIISHFIWDFVILMIKTRI